MCYSLSSMIREEDDIYAICIGIVFCLVFPDRLSYQSDVIFLYTAKIEPVKRHLYCPY